jgi:hypothetical protein
VAFSGYTENFKVIAVDQVYKSPLSGQLRQIKKSSKAREHLKKKKRWQCTQTLILEWFTA